MPPTLHSLPMPFKYGAYPSTSNTVPTPALQIWSLPQHFKYGPYAYPCTSNTVPTPAHQIWSLLMHFKYPALYLHSQSSHSDEVYMSSSGVL